MNDEWDIKPEPQTFSVSEDAVNQKAEALMSSVEMIEKLKSEGKFEEVYGEADRLRDKLSKYRQSGLETGGEFSVENLVFKALRNNEYLSRLSDLKREAYDELMTVKENER